MGNTNKSTFDANAIGAAINTAAGADKKFTSAKAAYDAGVIKFRDTVNAMGLPLTAFTRKGEYRAETLGLAAAAYLTKPEHKAFASDGPAKVKGVYTAKHKASVKVNNFLDRLVKNAMALDAAPNGKDAKAKADAKRGRSKPLADRLNDRLNELVKTTNVDKAKTEPSGKAHAETVAILKKAIKDIAALQA